MLSRQEANVTMFAGHVVIAVFAEGDSNPLGLRNLVMPLRASNISYNDLRHIIIVANIDFMGKYVYFSFVELNTMNNVCKLNLLLLQRMGSTIKLAQNICSSW